MAAQALYELYCSWKINSQILIEYCKFCNLNGQFVASTISSYKKLITNQDLAFWINAECNVISRKFELVWPHSS